MGFIFFLTTSKLEVYRPLIYILACAVAVGGAAKIYVRITYGNPGTAGTIPVVIEMVLPIFLIVSLVPRRKGCNEGNEMTNATGTNLCLDRTDSRAVMEEIMNLMRKERRGRGPI